MNTHAVPNAVADTQHEAPNHPYLTFRVQDEVFALPILAVREIIEYVAPSTVPLMPGFVSGVINLRGAVVPVIELSARLELGASRIGRRSCIVVVEVQGPAGRRELGVVVDAVLAVIDIPPSRIEPAPEFGAGLDRDFIAGMGKLDDGFVILLDPGSVLSIGEMTRLSGAGAPQVASGGAEAA